MALNMSNWDVYVQRPNGKQPIVCPAFGHAPDDALDDVEIRGDYIPQAGDRVVRCIEVNRNDSNSK